MSEALQAFAQKMSEHIQVVESARPGIYGNSPDYVWDCAEGKAASAQLLWTTIIHMQIALMLAGQPRDLTDKVDFDFARLCRTGQAELKRAEEDLKVICPELTRRREPPNFVRPAASAARIG